MANPSPIPVAIIGGGPVGLTASMLLSLRGIPHVLFERHPGTSIHPKACGINQRTNEVFRILGIEQDVYAACAPTEISGRLAWYTNLGPDGREIFSREAWGQGQYAEEYASHSPSQFRMLPQIRLEPILKRRAIELNPDGIRHRTEVTSLTEKDDGTVVLKVHDIEKDEQDEIVARFVICADGGRSFTEKLGVEWAGQKDIFNMVTAHFRAPIRSRHPDPRNFITWFTDPKSEGSVKSGAIYQLGPWPTPDDGSEEWVFLCNLSSNDPTSFTEKTMEERIRNALNIADIPIDILTLSHWNVNAINASKYRVGRVFLVGDAAHRIPPWGALGMNTGIQDVQNLVWKLELALGDENKYDSLLDSYDTERRPIGERVGLTSLKNLRMHREVMDTALGISDTKSLAENEAALEVLFDSTHPENANKRQAVKNAAKVLDTEFKASGSEVGWFYPSADINNEGGKHHGGQLLKDGTYDQTVYHPSTIPGHHLPHCWVEKQGKRVAIRDLVPLSKMLLLAQTSGWDLFENSLVQVEMIGSNGWKDVFGDWQRQCGLDKHGAVLVRPDGIVAWRGAKMSDLLEVWPALLDKVLYVGR
ncbi:uncharacterized protein NECHADRAFT_82515 [Fusarium vanettenii 77-13-4]|uniref:FAD-binding domain-containing protein n=1 Tax=Fusarium vanettenii (strain ATCC MYA-4622 / CBS 123669 / FGSC 9596 / NRRL 45880 / 77-13-4) TaxID=660122 RepID=C7YXF9_FUSV7|nr:uncharacterized protein NECHADRAFT_82515 [Fusarium vanettenii 77-13-4]EEU43583.1 hypothetical protein NECHADRAFT_82515 [Fusarium vanettenii 77-13-4]